MVMQAGKGNASYVLPNVDVNVLTLSVQDYSRGPASCPGAIENGVLLRILVSLEKCCARPATQGAKMSVTGPRTTPPVKFSIRPRVQGGFTSSHAPKRSV